MSAPTARELAEAAEALDRGDDDARIPDLVSMIERFEPSIDGPEELARIFRFFARLIADKERVNAGLGHTPVRCAQCHNRCGATVYVYRGRTYCYAPACRKPCPEHTTCRLCGRGIRSRRGATICSVYCQVRRAPKGGAVHRNCIVCGAPIAGGRADRIYCGGACQHRKWRADNPGRG